MTQPRQLIGPSTVKRMAFITLKGNAYERGVQYGQAFPKHLEAFYYWFVKKEPAEILTSPYRAVLEKMEAFTAQYFPLLLDEIKGWADGAKLPYDMCRLMAFHNDVRNVIAFNCSNVIVARGPQGPWLARSCDLFADERSWQIRRLNLCDDCWSFLCTGYLGLPSGVGLNSAGLAVGGSSLPVKPDKIGDGLANYAHYLLATQPTVESACEQFAKVPFLGKGVHLALLDATGDAAAVEMGFGRYHIRKDDGRGYLVATNHSPTGRLSMAADREACLENSRQRYERLVEVMEQTSEERWLPALGQTLLADHQRPISVCQHIPGGYHTVYAFVAQPAGNGEGKISICWGNPCAGKFVDYTLPPL